MPASPGSAAAPSASASASPATTSSASPTPAPTTPPAASSRWILANLTSIAGLTPKLVGAPRVDDSASPEGPAVCFDGDDGLIFEKNPIEGLAAFTIEVYLRFDAVTEAPWAEPRYLHIETADGRRATMEGRVSASDFYLDTFLLAGDSRLTLIEKARTHPVGRWTWTALTYDSGRMRHFVDGVEDARGEVTFPVTGPGRISLGVRQNLVHYLRGCIREVKVTPLALEPPALQRAR